MSCCSSSSRDRMVSSPSYCPACQQAGQPVSKTTPRHTLKKLFRHTLSAESDYHYCDTPECSIVYFTDNGEQTFTTKQLINRVTCKDPSPETPLCYCFKITKGDALQEYRESHQSSVLETIKQKMSEKSCFCDKSNPRGVCCTTEIRRWLGEQGIEESESPSTDSSRGSSCC